MHSSYLEFELVDDEGQLFVFLDEFVVLCADEIAFDGLFLQLLLSGPDSDPQLFDDLLGVRLLFLFAGAFYFIDVIGNPPRDLLQ